MQSSKDRDPVICPKCKSRRIGTDQRSRWWDIKYRCADCNEDHDVNDLSVNLTEEEVTVIDEIGDVIMNVVEKHGIHRDLLLYAVATQLESIKQYCLKTGDKSHMMETII